MNFDNLKVIGALLKITALLILTIPFLLFEYVKFYIKEKK